MCMFQYIFTEMGSLIRMVTEDILVIYRVYLVIKEGLQERWRVLTRACSDRTGVNGSKLKEGEFRFYILGKNSLW